MIRKDFILRLVDKLGLVLSKLFGLKQQGEYKQALDVIHKSLLDDAKVNIGRIADSDINNFEEDLKLKDIEPERLTFIGELLYEEAEIYEIMGEVEQCVDRRMKVLVILCAYLNSPSPKISLHLYNKMDGTIEYLKEFHLPFKVNKICFDYFNSQNKFAKAEDILFNMIGNTEQLNETQKIGTDFYEGLAKSDSSLLEMGDLTKEEVDNGCQEFLKKISEEIQLNKK